MKRLKEDVLKEIEFFILSGKYAAGQRLPAERDLALEFNVSRPVIHESLLILESRGLITLRPRHGAVINDFRKKGTLELLMSLLCHSEEELNSQVMESLYHMRMMLESDAAKLAAEVISDTQLQELSDLIYSLPEDSDPLRLAQRDFTIHHLIAEFSGNIIYPLLTNSLKAVYFEFLQIFYRNQGNVQEIRSIQENLLLAFQKREAERASELMKQLSSYTVKSGI